MNGTGQAAGRTGDATTALDHRLGQAGPRWTTAGVAALARAMLGRPSAATARSDRPIARFIPAARHDPSGRRESSGRRPFDPACVAVGCRCPPGWDACGTKLCRFLPMAHAHCGACGVACRADQLCSNGRCV